MPILTSGSGRATRGMRWPAVAALGFAVFATACADKGFTPPVARFSSKVSLQITVTAQQQVGFGPRFIVAAAGFDGDNKDNNNGNGDNGGGILGYSVVPFATGTVRLTVPVDLARCLAYYAERGRGACPLLVGAFIVADTAFISDTSSDSSNDPFNASFDGWFAGPFNIGPGGAVPTIPPIELSVSRFGTVTWQGDDALRLGGNDSPSNLCCFGNSGATISGVANGTATPTLFALTVGAQAPLTQTSQPFPQLAIFQNGNWRRVTATVAPSTLNNGQSVFNDVFALSASDVYMSSPTGLYTYNGTAISKVAAVTDQMYSVAATSTGGTTSLVIAGGNSGRVWIRNAQQVWQQSNLPVTNGNVDGVCITGPSEAFASISILTGSGLFRFDGTNWTAVTASTSGNRLDLQCPGPGLAYVVAGSSMLKWNGSSFQALPTTGLGFARSYRLGAASATEIYAYGDSNSTGGRIDRAFYKFNGTLWQEVGRLRFGQSAGRMWAVPGGGGAYVASSSASRVEAVTPTSVRVVSYQPLIRDLSVTSATNAFAVGANSFLGRWDGSKWNVDAPPPNTAVTRSLQGVWSDGPKNAWAVGNQNTVYRWDGSSWSVVSDAVKPLSAADNYWSVWGSGSDVWVVGDNSILHCKAPAACATEPSGGTGGLLGIWGSSTSHVIAVGDGGRIARYNGTSWAPMTSPTTRTLARVTGTGPSDVWAVGDSVLIHFDGTQWANVAMDRDLFNFRTHIPSPQERQSTTTQNFWIVPIGLWARNSKEVYLGGPNNGAIARWDGTEWRDVNSSRYRRRITAISGTSGGCVLAATDAQNDSPSQTLFRGIGLSGCFGSPMAGPTSWP